MNKIIDQTIAELQHLPLMLGKLVGGLTAVIGFTAAVIKTRAPNWSLRDIWVFLLIGSVGMVIFILAGRSLKRRSSGNIDAVPVMNVLSWGLLLLLAGIFLACLYFFTV